VRQTAVTAVLRVLSTGRPIELAAVRAREVSALSRPGRSLPGQNKEPSVKTLVACSGGLDSVTLPHKVAVDQTVIHLVTFDSWSCYMGGARHCGCCGTCVERREAFHLGGIDAATADDDPGYWREARHAYLAKHAA
jgi:hypothetical protein